MIHHFTYALLSPFTGSLSVHSAAHSVFNAVADGLRGQRE